MNREKAAKLIEENLHTIFAWCLSRLYDKTEAEDLAQDIICAVLKSVDRLEQDEAFFGYLWKTAENIFRMHLRKKRPENLELDDKCCGFYFATPEEEMIQSEQIQLLRRELSLLSTQYREVTVRYYIYDKSCSEISAELNISIEMVKYYLFKTRKILKEGIGMTREFGEKSYNPQTFQMDYWGNWAVDFGNSIYWKLFERRLPGNILLAAYDKPVTITELSVELGVAVVYLEDEVQILEMHELIKKTGDKYQTNIIIFTEDYEKRVLEKFQSIYQEAAKLVYHKIESILPALKNLEFYGNHYDENRLKWIFSNLVMFWALIKCENANKEKFGDYPLLSNGSNGFIFGYDNDNSNHYLNGIYGSLVNNEKTAWVSVENYCMIEKCQWFKLRSEKTISALTDAILSKNVDEENEEVVRMIEEGFISSNNGHLSPEFPVFTQSVFENIYEKLESAVMETYQCMEKICNYAAETLTDYVPKALKNICGQLACIHHQSNIMAYIMETLVEDGVLIIPDKKVNLCMFGVKVK